MKKLFAFVLFLFAFCLTANATQLTGTLEKPDGTGFTGTLYLSIAQQVGISSAGTCGGPVLVVPTISISVTVTNGVLQNPPAIYGGECTLPAGMPYNAILKDPSGNVMFSTQWLITGATQDVGTVFQGPSPIPPTAFVAIPGMGAPTALNPCSAQSMYLQLDATVGGNMWPCIDGTFTQQVGGIASGITMNTPVSGASNNAVLFVNTLGKLSQDSVYNYNVTTHTLGITNLVAASLTGTLTGNASTATAFASIPATCVSGQSATGVDVNGNAKGCFTPTGLFIPIASSTIFNGQSVASALTASGVSASAIVEANSTATDMPYMGWQTNQRYWILPTSPSSFHLTDYRNRVKLDYCYNTPPVGGPGNFAACNFLNVLNDTRPSLVPGTLPSKNINLLLTDIENAPSMYDTGRWTSSSTLYMNIATMNKSISQPESVNFSKWGIGDWASYHYYSYASGSPAGDDEGGTAYSNQLRENGATPNDTTAKILSLGTGTFGIANTSIIIQKQTGGSVGDGRPAVLTKDASGNDAAWLTTNATSVDGATYTTGQTANGTIGVTATVTPSTGIGTLTAPLSVPANFDVPQSVTFTVAITGGTSAGYNANAYACINGGTHFEKIYITNVTGAAGIGNVQTITANVRQMEAKDVGTNGNPQLWQDNANICGSWATLDSSKRIATTTVVPIRQFVPLLGAVDSHTLRYAFPAHGANRQMSLLQNDEIFPEVATAVLSSSGGVGTAVVTYPSGASFTNWANRNDIVVTGTTDFNGTYTFLPTLTPNTYTFAYSGGDFTSESGTATSATGRNTLHVYYGEEVINVSNPDRTDNSVVDHYVEFPPNTVPWVVGGTVEFPMYLYMPVRMGYDTMVTYSGMAKGYIEQYMGTGVSSDDFFGHGIYNTNGRTWDANGLRMYQGFGGFLKFPKAGLAIHGPWQRVIDVSGPGNDAGSATIPGGTILYAGCPITYASNITPCSNPNDSYNILTFGTKTGNGISFPYNKLYANVPNDSLDMVFSGSAFNYSFGKNGWKLGSDYNSTSHLGGLYETVGDFTIHVGLQRDLKLEGGNVYTVAGKGIGIGTAQVLTGVQGTAGTRIAATSGTFTTNHLRMTNATGDEVDSGVAGFTGSCPATSTITVVNGLITGCS